MAFTVLPGLDLVSACSSATRGWRDYNDERHASAADLPNLAFAAPDAGRGDAAASRLMPRKKLRDRHKFVEAEVSSVRLE